MLQAKSHRALEMVQEEGMGNFNHLGHLFEGNESEKDMSTGESLCRSTRYCSVIVVCSSLWC